MPDWVAHLAFAFLLGKSFRVRKISILLAGALIPDIGRITGFLPLSTRDAYALSLPFHSVAFSFVLAGIFASFLFRRVGLRPAFSLLFIGAMTHLFLDAMMLYAIGGVMPLVPFSYEPISSISLFPSQSFLPAIVLSVPALAYLAFEKIRKSRPQK